MTDFLLFHSTPSKKDAQENGIISLKLDDYAYRGDNINKSFEVCHGRDCDLITDSEREILRLAYVEFQDLNVVQLKQNSQIVELTRMTIRNEEMEEAGVSIHTYSLHGDNLITDFNNLKNKGYLSPLMNAGGRYYNRRKRTFKKKSKKKRKI